MYIYICIHIQRERERDTHTQTYSSCRTRWARRVPNTRSANTRSAEHAFRNCRTRVQPPLGSGAYTLKHSWDSNTEPEMFESVMTVSSSKPELEAYWRQRPLSECQATLSSCHARHWRMLASISFVREHSSVLNLSQQSEASRFEMGMPCGCSSARYSQDGETVIVGPGKATKDWKGPDF